MANAQPQTIVYNTHLSVMDHTLKWCRHAITFIFVGITALALVFAVIWASKHPDIRRAIKIDTLADVKNADAYSNIREVFAHCEGDGDYGVFDLRTDACTQALKDFQNGPGIEDAPRGATATADDEKEQQTKDDAVHPKKDDPMSATGRDIKKGGPAQERKKPALSGARISYEHTTVGNGPAPTPGKG